jgi:hypothetical protein
MMRFHATVACAAVLSCLVVFGCRPEGGSAGPGPRPRAPRRVTPAQVAASPKLVKVEVFSAVGSGAPTPDSKNARADQSVTLYAVVAAERGGRRALYGQVPDGGSRRAAVKAWDEAAWGPLTIRWFKVRTAKDNYSNWDGDQFRWAKLDYVEDAVPEWDDRWSVPPDVRTKWTHGSENVGTARFKVEVSQWDENGRRQRVASPGREATDQYGITEAVHRISIRPDDSFCGWLKALYGLPYIWGSDGPTAAKHQSERFVGCDCADFVIAAWRRCGHASVKYTWTTGLRNLTTTLHKGASLGADGEYHPSGAPAKAIAIGPAGVRPGDMLLFGRHVGAFSQDAGPDGQANGVLDRHDLMIHALFKAPAQEPIAEAYSGTFDVVRWR